MAETSERSETSPMEFRKKPVVITAMQNDGTYERAVQIVAWSNGRVSAENGDWSLSVRTLEGVMRADIGDWIICGVKGEFYPCKNEIFLQTYEPASAQSCLRAAADKLADVLANVHHLLTGYHPGYVGLNADGNSVFDIAAVAMIGKDVGDALADYRQLTQEPTHDRA